MSALVFPLGLDVFQALLGIKTVVFKPNYGQEMSGTASGNLNVKDLRPEKWAADITTKPWPNAQARRIQALLESLKGGQNSFYLYDPACKYPLAGNLDDSAVEVHSVGSDGTSIALEGLPPDFELGIGDMLTIPYGDDGVGLYRCLEDITADGSGVTEEFQVGGQGGVRIGTASGDSVTLVKPYGEFIMGTSWTPIQVNELARSFQFSAIEK